jgi:hypothetical protein
VVCVVCGGGGWLPACLGRGGGREDGIGMGDVVVMACVSV